MIQFNNSLFTLLFSLITSALFAQRVGVNTATPDYELDVNGNIGLGISSGGNLYSNSDATTNLRLATGRFLVFAGNSTHSWIDCRNATSELVINEGSRSRDFRVESQRNTHMLFMDGSTDRFGINTSSPAFKLDVRAGTYTGASAAAGIIGSRTHIGHGANSTNDAITSFQGLAETNTWESFTTELIGVHGLSRSNGTSRSPVLNLYGIYGEANGETAGNQTAIGGKFTATGADFNYALITENGNVGFGTSAPTEQLDVNGQIRMRSGATNGYIITGDANGVMSWTDPATLLGSSSSDADWFVHGGTNSPTSISDNIYTQGTVAIGSTTASNAKMMINGSTSTVGYSVLRLEDNNNNVGERNVNALSVTTQGREQMNIYTNGDMRLDGRLVLEEDGTGTEKMTVYTGSNGDLYIQNDNAVIPLTVGDNNSVGINTSIPNANYKLDVNGNSRIGFHGSSTRIVLTPRDFIGSDNATYNSAMIEDDINGELSLRTSISTVDLYAMVYIPLGYKVIGGTVYANQTGLPVEMGYVSIVDGSKTASVTGGTNNGMSIASGVNSDLNRYFYVKINPSSSTNKIFGAYLNIQRI